MHAPHHPSSTSRTRARSDDIARRGRLYRRVVAAAPSTTSPSQERHLGRMSSATHQFKYIPCPGSMGCVPFSCGILLLCTRNIYLKIYYASVYHIFLVAWSDYIYTRANVSNRNRTNTWRERILRAHAGIFVCVSPTAQHTEYRLYVNEYIFFKMFAERQPASLNARNPPCKLACRGTGQCALNIHNQSTLWTFLC